MGEILEKPNDKPIQKNQERLNLKHCFVAYVNIPDGVSQKGGNVFKTRPHLILTARSFISLSVGSKFSLLTNNKERKW